MSEEPQIRILIRPEPTELERQAIITAMEQLWPSEPIQKLSTRWRFSGRWWSKQTDWEIDSKRWQ